MKLKLLISRNAAVRSIQRRANQGLLAAAYYVRNIMLESYKSNLIERDKVVEVFRQKRLQHCHLTVALHIED